ncbi:MULTISPECIES: transcriptional regulator [Streptomyces]|uniref:transcriptional regulator n=1 Tax=Streptomyces TaxID=1883 RepID=UPI0029CCC690|nr:transcriptional regulator [Streptomyces sp. F8]MDX6761606.1 transcriptional regulator [Streptomyces sp. F8]
MGERRGEEHVHRLRLIRTLIGIRGLSANATKEILHAITTEQDDLQQVFGIVLGVPPTTREGDAANAGGADAQRPEGEPGGRCGVGIGPGPGPGPGAGGLGRGAHADRRDGVGRFPGNPAARGLAEVLAALSDLGADIDRRGLLPYARLADSIADLDVRQMRGERDLLAQAERAVLVSILLEPALLALRRLAQESKSSRHFGGGSAAP